MENVLSIKIITCDYYNTAPIQNLDVTYSEFRQIDVKNVPVLRIFGITKEKLKICCNIHNVNMSIFIINQRSKLYSLIKGFSLSLCAVSRIRSREN